MKTKMDMAYFLAVAGSVTSEDGQTFMLHVKRSTGGDLLLEFPHSEIPNIVENAAMQAAHGRDAAGIRGVAVAVRTSPHFCASKSATPKERRTGRAHESKPQRGDF